MDYKIIEKMACVMVQLDSDLHKAVALADYLVQSKYDVTEVRSMVTLGQCIIILDKCDTAKLRETLDFYLANCLS